MSIRGLVARHRYELIALLTGAAVMILEIIGARLIAPYFGTSTYVWTAMIGVILGALSLGFWYGGKLADQYDSKKDLSLIIAGSAFLIFLTALLQEPVLRFIAGRDFDLRLSSVIAASILFGPPSLLIGMVSPHLAKIRLTNLKTSGATVGRLEAAGAIGSILGTFLSGYVLLAYFGSQKLTFMLVVLLLFTSFLANRRKYVLPRVGLIVMAVFLVFSPIKPIGVLQDIDSAYARYWVVRGTKDRMAANFLVMDSYSSQSAVYIDNPSEPAFAYTRAMIDLARQHPDVSKVLIIGGGAYTMPTFLRAQHEELTIDVVEIDPAMDEIARQHFSFTDHERTTIFHEDGRSFLNQNEKSYDLIYMDAFSSLTPPFQLTTLEAVQRIDANLADNGAVVVNVPGSHQSDFLRSMLRTYEQVFDSVQYFQADSQRSLSDSQNFIVIASHKSEITDKHSRGYDILPINIGGYVLTDDFAPIERLTF